MSASNDDDSTAASVRTSSSFGSVHTGGSIDLTSADLIYLGEEHCRTRYTVSKGDGGRAGIICGRTVTPGHLDCDCTTHRSVNMNRRPPGYYIRRTLKRGSALVAEDADPIPKAAYEELLETEATEAAARQADLAAAAAALAGVAIGGTAANEQPNNRPRVGIDTAANTYHSAGSAPPQRPAPPAGSGSTANSNQGDRQRDPDGGGRGEAPPPSTGQNQVCYLGHERADGKRTYSNSEKEEARLRRNGWNVVAAFDTLAAALLWVSQTSSGPAATAAAPAFPAAAPTEPTRLYLGHEKADGRRSYSHTAGEEERLCRNGWNVVAFFDTKQEALRWVSQARPKAPGNGGGNGGDGGDDDGGGGGSAKPSSGSSKDSERKPKHKKSSHKSSKDSQRKSSSSSKHRSSHRSDKSDSSWASSSASSSSASSNSDSASSKSSRKHKKGHRQRRRHRGRGRRHDNNSVRKDPVRMFSKDESTGDSKRVFGMEIGDRDLERALCPDGMHSEDRKGLGTCFTDVTAMPGAYKKAPGLTEKSDVEMVMEGAVSLLAQATGNRAQLPDGQWKVDKKTKLRSIKSSADLMTMSEELQEAQATIFEQQDDNVRIFLQQRHYSSSEVKEYLATGLWIRIIRDTFTNYVNLILMLVYHASLHGYSGGLVERMVNHWATKLLQIRLYSPNYVSFQLKVYTCLRDGNAVKFDDLTIYRPMIQDLLDKTNNNNGGGGGNNNTPKPDATCSHCKNRKVHDILGIGSTFGYCPFKPPLCDRKQARAAGKHFVTALTADSNADHGAAIKAAVAAAKSTD